MQYSGNTMTLPTSENMPPPLSEHSSSQSVPSHLSPAPNLPSIYAHYPPTTPVYPTPMHASPYFPVPPHILLYPVPCDTVPSLFPDQRLHLHYPEIDPSLCNSAIANLPTLLTHKCKYNTKGQTTGKRRKSKHSPNAISKSVVPTEVVAATTCGVGPTESESDTHADLHCRHESEGVETKSQEGRMRFRLRHTGRSPEHSKTAATDVWYHLRPLMSSKPPAIWPEDLPKPEDTLRSFPTTPYVGCKPCSEPKEGSKRQWKTWKHGTGMTTCYRTYLKTKHPEEYKQAINEHGLKIHELEDIGGLIQEPFTVPMFHHLLMKWVVEDDQSRPTFVTFSATLAEETSPIVMSHIALSLPCKFFTHTEQR
ncbi:hypothetical protein JVU11DRAFT_10643 [Chiua virens]|nr:hypothetical protein JVU11DRAFT_10639 [Chiua virens]KAG9309395.1 hypothetical protein JVU11DRAFT_10643 [Chiua virens]